MLFSRTSFINLSELYPGGKNAVALWGPPKPVVRQLQHMSDHLEGLFAHG